MRAFLRAYYHMKNADWTRNRPYPLAEWSASELAKLPTYYIMRLDEDMAQTLSAARDMVADLWRLAHRFIP